jgi:hypothetical protein
MCGSSGTVKVIYIYMKRFYMKIIHFYLAIKSQIGRGFRKNLKKHKFGIYYTP